MKTANLIKLAANNPKARKALIPLIIKSANLKNKEVVKGLVKLAMSNPEYAELFAERIASEPSYRDYVDRKRKQGEKPLSEEEWETRVKGKGDEEKGDEEKGEGKKGKPPKGVSGNAEVGDRVLVRGEAKIYGDAKVSGYANVSENARVSGNARVGDHTEMWGNSHVYGNAQVRGTAAVYGNAVVFGKAEVYGDARVSGKARVSGSAKVFSRARILSEATIKNEARVQGNAQVGGKAVVGGQSEIDGNAVVTGRAQIKDAYIRGNAFVCGNAEIEGVSAFGDCIIIGGKWDIKSVVGDDADPTILYDDGPSFGSWKDPSGWKVLTGAGIDEKGYGELKAFREKKSKQKKGKKSWEELKKEFLQNAKDPETKKRVQEMSPKDFEVMMKAIATDDEIAEAEKMG